MTPKQLPLFWKFSIAISFTVLVFGSLNLLFIRSQVYRTFENQIEKHGISIAMGIAERAVEPILYDDLAALNQLLLQTKLVNPDINYIFILDVNRRIVAHTFADFLPRGITELNTLQNGQNVNIQIIIDRNDRRRIIRDIAIPILENQMGTVRIGMSEDAFLGEMRTITSLFLGMVLFFLVLGIVAAFVFSYIITSPIKAISTHASQVNFHSTDFASRSNVVINKQFPVRLKNPFGLTDEIDILSTTFNGMLQRIETAYRDLKEAHDSLSQSEKMASVGTLAAGLAHEINNPLAGIRNCIRRITDKPENVRQNLEYISMMSEALERIERVVEGMLSFSRKQKMVLQPVDLVQLIENSIALVGYQFERSGIKLDKHFSARAIPITASPNHLEQVFVNVMLNSIDSINERKQVEPDLNGEVSIIINTGDDSINIAFTDNGTGVPPEKVASIFDPFFTLKKIKQGTGLGLAVSYNIIKSHNGQIMGHNNSEGGFTVTISLPNQ